MDILQQIIQSPELDLTEETFQLLTTKLNTERHTKKQQLNCCSKGLADQGRKQYLVMSMVDVVGCK